MQTSLFDSGYEVVESPLHKADGSVDEASACSLDVKIAEQEALIQDLERRLEKWKQLHGETSTTYIAQKDWLKRERLSLVQDIDCHLSVYKETHGEDSALYQTQKERLHRDEEMLLHLWCTLIQNLEHRVAHYEEARNKQISLCDEQRKRLKHMHKELGQLLCTNMAFNYLIRETNLLDEQMRENADHEMLTLEYNELVVHIRENIEMLVTEIMRLEGQKQYKKEIDKLKREKDELEIKTWVYSEYWALLQGRDIEAETLTQEINKLEELFLEKKEIEKQIREKNSWCRHEENSLEILIRLLIAGTFYRREK